MVMVNNKNVLISGAGIAGTALAYWLNKFGFRSVIVEHAPNLREGGYGIDFWGTGYDIAEKMGIIAQLNDADMGISEVVFVDANDRAKARMNYDKLKKLMKGRAITLLRSDLARVIYNALDENTEIIFGDSISALQENEHGVTVTFTSGLVRDFDLVVGADGLHSRVRELVFGNESQFEKYFGYYTASYTIERKLATRQLFPIYTVPGKQVASYATKDGKTTAFFTFSSPGKLDYDHRNIEAQKQILRREFAETGWHCKELLENIHQTPDFYFDVVSQIQMTQWSKGRISLVGDACDCPSLLSGQGSTLAIVGAYVLAGELKDANGDYRVAFARYQAKFKPFLDKKQALAQKFARSFVPKSRVAIWIRNMSVRAMYLPIFSKIFVNQFMDDDLTLKEY